MATLIYCLCALTSLASTALLFNGYRRNRYRLLFWSALCFAGLTINNIFLILDRIVFPQIDFLIWRLITSLIAMLLLLFGLIWEED